MLRRVRLDLAYEGTRFAGWQIQRNARTVQGVLSEALERLEGRSGPVHVRGAGRTDAGVHARQQVADCDVADPRSDAQLAYALRRMLPFDIRPWRVCSVPETFHSRHNACSKVYRYTVDRTQHGDPFSARHALHVPEALDPGLIRSALELLPGRRDWSGFVAAGCKIENRVRTMLSAELEVETPGRWHLVFHADGFLRYMVRNVVGTLLEVGRGRMDVEQVAAILSIGDRNLAGPTAAPHGLCLERVLYPEDRL